ncbi:biopolymer transporter ExbD [uncultured Shewanella sp.]|uniref:ExbD/TolR family protein n=1 Tax=uncultured Shewanella sp. TaxID=173975 RepID=UPI0026291490|nr:biopolymer transporter ExbD [uncultured Shewanella sp.]
MKLKSLFGRAIPGSKEPEELDITPFMSLMIVLIPVLLISLKFTLLANYDISNNTPPQNVTKQKSNTDKKMILYRLLVKKDKALLQQNSRILFEVGIEDKDAIEHQLLNLLENQKAKPSIVLDIESDHSYQTIVNLLDMLNQHGDKFSSISLSVKEGL